MDKKQLDDLIDKLVLGEITEEENKVLTEQKHLDPTLDQEIKLRMDIYKGVKYDGDQKLRKLLNKIHDEVIHEKDKIIPINRNIEKPEKKNRWLFYMAGSVAAVFIVYLGVFGLSNQTSSAELYKQYYETYIPSGGTRGEINEATITAFNDAYTEKNYAKALTIIQSQLSDANNDIKLTAAVAAIEIGNTNKAQEILNDILSSKDFYFSDHAKWYLSLLYLKQSETTAASALLEELAQDVEADHHAEAKKILEELK